MQKRFHISYRSSVRKFFFVILCLLQRIGSAGGRGRLCEGEEGGGRWVCGTRDGGCGGEGIMATAFSGY